MGYSVPFEVIYTYTAVCAYCGNLAQLGRIRTPGLGAIWMPEIPYGWHEVDRQAVCPMCWKA